MSARQGGSEPELIHEWGAGTAPFSSRPAVLDETLRDGLQSPSVRDPSLDDKIRLLHNMERIGIEAANVGLPGAHARQQRDALALVGEIAREKMDIVPYCAARTLVKDVEPIVAISQKAGIEVGVGLFIGSSPIRQYVEGWSRGDLQRRTEESVTFAVAHGLSVMFVTEDTTRSTPDSLQNLYRTALRCGASRLCISDTVGCANPAGTMKIVQFVKALIDESGGGVGLDWHGHRDRGLDVANCLAAWAAGADRCHGTALGIGERCGNTPMEMLLANLALMGWDHYRLSHLMDYVSAAAGALDIEIPSNQPVVGHDAFRTATGTHAAAVLKAEQRGDVWLADRVYSGVPAGMVGRRQAIDVGPLSGKANVVSFFGGRGLSLDDRAVSEIVETAKEGNVVLSTERLQHLVGQGGLKR